MIEISKNLYLEKVNLKIAQNFWNNSSEGLFFTNPSFLEKFEKKIDYWMVKKGDEQLCLWPICIKKKFTTLPLFSYYFGPFWSQPTFKFSLTMQVYELFFKNFEKKYLNIHFNFHPNNHDVRYFIWKKNFKDKNQILIYPKYSAIISNLNKKKDIDIYKSFNSLRRRMISKAKKNKLFLKTNFFKLDEIIKLYRNTILKKNKNQNINQKELKENINKIKSFYRIYENDKSKISFNGLREKKTNKLISLIMLGNAKNTTNLILNLSDKDYQKTGVSALLMFDSIKKAKRKKIDNFDFNGSNSFVGSSDKHSYGSNYRLYFEIKSTI